MLTTFLISVLSFLVAVLCWRLIVTTNRLAWMGTCTPEEFSTIREAMIANYPDFFDRVRKRTHGEGR